MNQSDELAGGSYGFETERMNDLAQQDRKDIPSRDDEYSGTEVEMTGIQSPLARDSDISEGVNLNSPRMSLTTNQTLVYITESPSPPQSITCTVIGHRPTREIERKYRKQYADPKTDFADFLQFLLSFYRSTQNLDAAGFSLLKVFDVEEDTLNEDRDGYISNRDGAERSPFIPLKTRSVSQMRAMFKDWILNFDVYGSFMPLTPEYCDIQMARTASFTKLVALRKRLSNMIEFWQDVSEESGRLMQIVI